MKYIILIGQISVLYFIYYVGNLIQWFLHISIPGSLIGMLLLYLLLQLKIIKEKWLQSGANVLLTYLSLLFVPATVGVVNYFSLFKGKGLISVGIVLFSTFLVMSISSIVGQVIAKKQERNKDQGKGFEGSFEA